MLADIYLLRFRLDTEDNLLARKHVTQVRILQRRGADADRHHHRSRAALDDIRVGAPVRRQSLFASAGVAGIVVGFAARPLLSNLIAGMQLAMTQPIRIDDAVVVENEWGWIEEITVDLCRDQAVGLAADDRAALLFHREAVPELDARRPPSCIGSVFHLCSTTTVPVEAHAREGWKRSSKASPLWDGSGRCNLQVTDAKQETIEVARPGERAQFADEAFDLRCEVREKLIAFLQRKHPARAAANAPT